MKHSNYPISCGMAPKKKFINFASHLDFFHFLAKLQGTWDLNSTIGIEPELPLLPFPLGKAVGLRVPTTGISLNDVYWAPTGCCLMQGTQLSCPSCFA